MGRIILAGIVGGIVMFVWSYVAHEFLHVGHMGLKSLANEEVVTTTFKQSIPEPGFYFFPGADFSKEMSEDEKKAWTERYRTGPTGLILYRPVGGELMQPKQFVIEGVANILAAIVAAAILTMMACTFSGRVAAAFAIGVIAWLSISVSQWNWWGFPTEHLTGEAIDIVGGWLIAGIVMAMMIGKARRASA